MNKLRKYELITLISISLLFLLYFLKTLDILSLSNFKVFIEDFGTLAPVVFMLVFILLALIGVGTSFLMFLTGLIFGFTKGFVISIISLILASSIAFYISRHFFWRYMRKKTDQKQRGFFRKILTKLESNAAEHNFFTILILRLSFFPYIELSYGAGLLKDIKYRYFIAATFLSSIFESFIFIFLGTSFTKNIPFFILAVILVILFILTPRYLKRHNLFSKISHE